MFERSLGDIQNAYESSWKQMNQDFGELELVAKDMKVQRNQNKIKHLNNLRTVEEEFCKIDDEVDLKKF